MDVPRAQRRRAAKKPNESKNGAKPDKVDDIDEWLAGEDMEPHEPIAIHRFQVCIVDYQKAVNTRWSARRYFLVGKDIGDEALMNSARADGKRARGLLESAIEGLTEAYLEFTPMQREEQLSQLTDDLAEILTKSLEVRPPDTDSQEPKQE